MIFVKFRGVFVVRKSTYTKRIMTLIVIISLIDLQLPFILAFFGKEQIAETLGGLIVTELMHC